MPIARPAAAWYTLALIPLFFASLVWLSSCALPEEPQRNFWDLGSPEKDSPGMVRFFKDTPAEEITRLLGKPTNKRPSQTHPGEEEWVFERVVYFGTRLKHEQNVDGSSVTVQQRGRYSENALMRFKEGRLSGASIHRIPLD